MNTIKKHSIIFATSVFFLYLSLFQYPFLDYQLGVLTTYIHNFNALNEISFWSALYGDQIISSSSNSPLKFNFIAWLLFLLSKFISESMVFSAAPVVFTTISFFFALKIFELYKLQSSWSVLLAFLGMTSISAMPLFETLVNLITFGIIFQSENVVYFDLLASFSSSLVLAVFLSLLFLTLKNQIYKSKYTNFISLLWALSIFIHPALFIFGYSFSLLVNAIELRREQINNKPYSIRNFLLFHITPLIFVIPFIFYNISFFGSSPDHISTIQSTQFLTFFKAIFLYFIIPFGLMVFANKIFRVDPYESLLRFWPILIIAFLEIFLRLLLLLDLLPIDDHVILDRVAVYFLHFFYFVPFLSVTTRVFTYLPDLQNKNDVLLSIRQLLNFIFIKLGNPIAFLMVLIVSISTYNSIDHQSYKIVDSRANLLKNNINEILLNKNFSNKKISFLSMDEKIISTFLFRNQIPLNIFINQGSSSQSKELNFLQGIYQRSDLQPTRKEDFKITETSFNQNSFYDNKRNLALVLWLKYNNTYYEIAKPSMTQEDILEETNSFFEENYLVAQHIPEQLIESDLIVKTQVGQYYVMNKK